MSSKSSSSRRPTVGQLRAYIDRRLSALEGTSDRALLVLCQVIECHYQKEADVRTLALWWHLLRTAHRHLPSPPRKPGEKSLRDIMAQLRREIA